jgi:hypothetical protein
MSDEVGDEDVDVGTWNLERLHRIHVRRYESLIARGGPNVRVDECKQLLRIWDEVKLAGFDFERLSEEAKNEIMDAIISGE